mmetsp:Transcript_45257/g.92370  ORF Transcript_45257/g.92370 Transcript_45257/m.92370 type:complete len:233 (+) Transcript_45257:212-910(+)
MEDCYASTARTASTSAEKPVRRSSTVRTASAISQCSTVRASSSATSASRTDSSDTSYLGRTFSGRTFSASSRRESADVGRKFSAETLELEPLNHIRDSPCEYVEEPAEDSSFSPSMNSPHLEEPSTQAPSVPPEQAPVQFRQRLRSFRSSPSMMQSQCNPIGDPLVGETDIRQNRRSFHELRTGCGLKLQSAFDPDGSPELTAFAAQHSFRTRTAYNRGLGHLLDENYGAGP